MRHFSTLSKRVEFSTRGESGKVQVERSRMVDEVGGKGDGDRAGSLALLSCLFFIAMVSRVSLRGWLCEKEEAAEEEVTEWGMRSRYNHGENYFQAPGRIISTPLRRLGGGG